MNPFDQAWAVLKMPMVPGSLERREVWEDIYGDNVRYVADFEHPQTGEIHPMVADVNFAEEDYSRIPHPLMDVSIFPPNHDVEDVPKLGSAKADWDSQRGAIAVADFKPQPSDENFYNRKMIGHPRVEGAGPINRIQGFQEWKEDNPEYSDISLADYMEMLHHYKHEGHGTAMYDMAADILNRETRGGHVIVRDENQTDAAKRMWRKHAGKENWPHRGQR